MVFQSGLCAAKSFWRRTFFANISIPSPRIIFGNPLLAIFPTKENFSLRPNCPKPCTAATIRHNAQANSVLPALAKTAALAKATGVFFIDVPYCCPIFITKEVP